MGKQLWWMEPARFGRKRRFADFAIAFGTSTILGLGAAAESGGKVGIHMGSFELSVPAHAWQYALWAAVALVGGCAGVWIMSFGGRAEVSLAPDGVQWLLGRATRRFYPYARMQRCEMVRGGADGWLLRIVMQPDSAQGTETVKDIAIARRIDHERVRAVLHTAGVAID